ncbi:MAG: tyrosine-type recombinase/integrase, partial [Bacteroidetes bacterium]|nr:tyrosine-type recombinase/integrase [Bacteroidota bacterium]
EMQRRAILEEKLRNLETWLIQLGYAQSTINQATRNITIFFNWLKENKVELEKLSPKELQIYNRHLHESPSKTGKILRRGTIKTHLRSLKLLDNYYQKQEGKKLLTTDLKLDKELPIEIEILSISEIQKLYKEIESNREGQLDKVILGLFYGCGLRLREGLNLKLEEIDFKYKLLEIVKSKTKTNRYIPLNSRIIQDLKSYINHTRKYIIEDIQEKHLLINPKTGRKVGDETIRRRIKLLLSKANISKQISTHNLRHSIGSHLLKQGMSIEQISQFLGHQSLESTKIYTKISNERKF